MHNEEPRGDNEDEKHNKSILVNFSLGQMNEESKEEDIYRKHLQERVSMVCWGEHQEMMEHGGRAMNANIIV